MALKYYHGECYICKYNKHPSVLTPATMVHHIKPVRKYPEYALSLFCRDDNGNRQVQLMPLCHDCHALIEYQQKHGDGKQSAERVSRQYPEKW